VHNTSTQNSFKYVSYKDIKAFSKDFKEVYRAINEEVAMEKFCEIKDKWGRNTHMQYEAGKTTGCDKSFYKFPEEIRKIIYTTNIIEGLHRQFEK